MKGSLQAPEQQAILARDSAGSLESMEEAAAAQQAQLAALGSALADKEAQLAALSDRLSASEQALSSAQQQQQQQQEGGDSSGPAVQQDGPLAARWACLAAQRQELAARWQCLAEERKQLSWLMQQAGRRGGGECGRQGQSPCAGWQLAEQGGTNTDACIRVTAGAFARTAAATSQHSAVPLRPPLPPASCPHTAAATAAAFLAPQAATAALSRGSSLCGTCGAPSSRTRWTSHAAAAASSAERQCCTLAAAAFSSVDHKGALRLAAAASTRRLWHVLCSTIAATLALFHVYAAKF